MKARIQLLKSADVDNSAVVMFGEEMFLTDEVPYIELRNADLSADMYVVRPAVKPSTDKIYLIFDPKTHTFEVNRIGSVTYDNFNSVDRYRYTNLAGDEIQLSDIEEIIATTDDLPGIPKIHRCFINAYVTIYNHDTDGVITDVWVVEEGDGKPVVLSNNTIVIKKYINPEDEQPKLAVNGESFTLGEAKPYNPLTDNSGEGKSYEPATDWLLDTLDALKELGYEVEPLDEKKPIEDPNPEVLDVKDPNPDSEAKKKEEQTQRGIQKLLHEIFDQKTPKEVLMEELTKQHEALMEILDKYYEDKGEKREPIVDCVHIESDTKNKNKVTLTVNLVIPDTMTDDEFYLTDLMQNILSYLQ